MNCLVYIRRLIADGWQVDHVSESGLVALSKGALKQVVGLDADLVVYYWDGYSASNWSNAANMINGNAASYAYVPYDAYRTAELDHNTCPGDDLGSISTVEFRACYRAHAYGQYTRFTPVFLGGDGTTYQKTDHWSALAWCAYIDITENPNAPSPWTWSDVEAMGCRVYGHRINNSQWTSKVELRVTYSVAPPVGAYSFIM